MVQHGLNVDDPLLLPVDDPLLLPERKVHAEIGICWFLDQDIPSHPEGRYVRILAESLLWEEYLGETRIRTTQGLITCWSRTEGGQLRAAVDFFPSKAIVGLRKQADHVQPRGN